MVAKYIGINLVSDMTGLEAAALLRMERSGEFPSRSKWHGDAHYWYANQVEKWITDNQKELNHGSREAG